MKGQGQTTSRKIFKMNKVDDSVCRCYVTPKIAVTI